MSQKTRVSIDSAPSSDTVAGAAGASYLGQTAIEAEFLDSRSNEVLAAYVDRQAGKKYDVDLSQGVGSAVEKGVSSYTKAYSTWAYAEAAFDYWAGLLRKRLDEAHGFST